MVRVLLSGKLTSEIYLPVWFGTVIDFQFPNEARCDWSVVDVYAVKFAFIYPIS